MEQQRRSSSAQQPAWKFPRRRLGLCGYNFGDPGGVGSLAFYTHIDTLTLSHSHGHTRTHTHAGFRQRAVQCGRDGGAVAEGRSRRLPGSLSPAGKGGRRRPEAAGPVRGEPAAVAARGRAGSG